jgi:drug/metabolite transporter (DMT)-like permease
MTRGRVQLILLVVPMSWGLVFVAVKKVLEEMNAFQLTTIRFAMISAVFLALLMRPDMRRSFRRGTWKLLVFAGLMAVPASQLPVVHAQNFLSPALAAIVPTTAPAMAAILAGWFLGERVTRGNAVGFGVAFLGAAIVIVVGAGEDASLEVSNLAGAALALITPLAWALYTLVLKKMTGDHSALAGVGATLVVGTAFMLPFAPAAVDAGGSASLEAWLWPLFLAIGGSLIPYLIWFWSMRYLDANETSAYLYLVPLFALFWSLVILGDLPPLGALGGGVLVLVGVALTQRSRSTPAPVPEEAP